MTAKLRWMLATFLGIAAMHLAARETPAKAAQPGLTVLYRFSGGEDGGEPLGPLIADAAGNLYGVTNTGGGAGVGVVFELSPKGRAWTEIVLHSFSGLDGAEPNGGLALDSKGNLYGTTFSGSASRSQGVVFELSPDGRGGWTFALLEIFQNPISRFGAVPDGSPLLDAEGNLFDTTQLGGGNGPCEPFGIPCGLVYELTGPPRHNGLWKETPVYSFDGPPDGAFPYASGLVMDSAGNLYGTTNIGGSGECKNQHMVIGCGTVFELSRKDRHWKESILYNFQPSEQNMPFMPVALGDNDTLYGAAGHDIFQLSPPETKGGNWTKETIYEFPLGKAGTVPSSGVALDSLGNLYGTTASSVTSHKGYSSVFELSPPQTMGGSWSETTLATFGKGEHLNQPLGGVLVGKDGTLYGAVAGAKGSVFAITH